MAPVEAELEENLHHLTHLGAGLPVVEMGTLQVHHPLVGHQVVHNHHLLLDHKRLPIVLVEHCLEGVHCILVSADLDRAELEHLSVIADPMTLAWR